MTVSQSVAEVGHGPHMLLLEKKAASTKKMKKETVGSHDDHLIVDIQPGLTV